MTKVAQKKISPDWLRPAEVAVRFGISRGTLYRLIKRKEVKSISLGRDGRSARLVHYASLLEYLEKLWEEQSGQDQ